MDFFVIRNSVFSGFLLLAAWQDLRHKEIEIRILWAGVVLAGVLCVGQGIWLSEELSLQVKEVWKIVGAGRVLGSMPGVALLALGRLTGGGIGAGDGWFFLVSGLILGLQDNFTMLCGGILLCGSWALGLYCWKWLKGNADAGKGTLPFLPFATVSWFGMVAVGWMEKVI